MPDYKALYYQLFAAVADATQALEENRVPDALLLLIAAQQQAEEDYLIQTDP